MSASPTSLRPRPNNLPSTRRTSSVPVWTLRAAGTASTTAESKWLSPQTRIACCARVSSTAHSSMHAARAEAERGIAVILDSIADQQGGAGSVGKVRTAPCTSQRRQHEADDVDWERHVNRGGPWKRGPERTGPWLGDTESRGPFADCLMTARSMAKGPVFARDPASRPTPRASAVVMSTSWTSRLSSLLPRPRPPVNGHRTPTRASHPRPQPAL